MPFKKRKGPGPSPKPSSDRSEVPYGTLDLLILQTLRTLGSQHGFGIARRMEQVSLDTLKLNQGSIYPALLRLEQQGWIDSSWGLSENNRRAKFYDLTSAGKKQLESEIESWHQTTALVELFLGAEGTR